MSRAIPVQSLMAGLIDASGNPLSGGKVYSYEAGTSTPKALYTTQDKLSTATNPVILNSLGQALVYAEGNYKFVVHSNADVLISTWDNLLFETADEMAKFLGQTSGSSNTYSGEASPSLSAYAEGQTFTFIANHTNTGASTLNIDSLGAKALVKGASAGALAGQEIQSGDMITVVYESASGGRFRVVGQYHGYMSAIRLQNIAGSNLSISCSDATAIKFRTLNADRFEVDANGHFVPNADSSHDIGTSTKYLRRLFTDTIVQQINYDISAAGTDQASATQIDFPYCNVASGSVDAGVRVAAASHSGVRRIIHNNSGVRIRVFPASGCTFGTLGANNPFLLYPNQTVYLFSTTTTQWFALGQYISAQTYATVGTYARRDATPVLTLAQLQELVDTLIDDLRRQGILK